MLKWQNWISKKNSPDFLYAWVSSLSSSGMICHVASEMTCAACTQDVCIGLVKLFKWMLQASRSPYLVELFLLRGYYLKLRLAEYPLWNQHLHYKVWSLLVLIYFIGLLLDLKLVKNNVGWSRVTLNSSGQSLSSEGHNYICSNYSASSPLVWEK